MFKKIISNNLNMVNDYLNVQPLFSLFFKADIEKYGCESEVFTIWGDFENNKLNYLIGKFYDTLLLYSNDDITKSDEITKFIIESKINFNVMVGKTSLAEQIETIIPFSKIHKNYICELTKGNFKPISYNDIEIIKAELKHSNEIIKLLNSIEEFKGLMNQEIIKEFIKYGYTYIIIENNQIVSLVMCSAKTNSTANIGTVCTSLEYRNKGYASKSVSFLSNILLNEVERCIVNCN